MIWGLKLTTLSTAWPKTLRLNHQCKSVASHHGAGTFLRDGKRNILPSMTMFVGVGLNMVDDYPDVWQCMTMLTMLFVWSYIQANPFRTHLCSHSHRNNRSKCLYTPGVVGRWSSEFKSNQNVLAHTIPNAAEVYNSHPGMISDDKIWMHLITHMHICRYTHHEWHKNGGFPPWAKPSPKSLGYPPPIIIHFKSCLDGIFPNKNHLAVLG